MIVNELINPKSIAIIGGSNDIEKPGGKIIANLVDGGYKGKLQIVNPREKFVQGFNCINDIAHLDECDLAFLAIPAKFCLDAVRTLALEKNTKAFIILSAGFSEFGEEGKRLEAEIVKVIESVGATLIGPNCIRIINQNYKGFFAGLIPKLNDKGCDFVSASGATIAFVLEVAVPRGLTFNSIYSIGNAAQIGIEEIFEFWDNSFVMGKSSKVKLFYTEKIANPHKLLKHAKSLISKGCHIAGIKAGTTEAGSRAVSSHTGALAGSDSAVSALFKKAGIIRCFSRVDLVYVAGILKHKQLDGNRLAVITHAGGSGVLLTDALIKGGMQVPHIEGEKADELLTHLHTGSSVANPIDFLATGTADQLGTIIEYVDREFDNIDGSVVVFGTSGMFDVMGVYDVLHEKMKWCKKPIYPVLPSVVQAEKAVKHFLSLGRIDFTDEVTLGKALSKIYHTAKPANNFDLPHIDNLKIRSILDKSDNGYLDAQSIQEILDACEIPRPQELIIHSEEEINSNLNINFPLVAKVLGSVHKTEVGGVILNIKDEQELIQSFHKLMQIENASGILIQAMASGIEMFIGATYEENYGHIILIGLGGIYIEVLNDFSVGLAPISKEETSSMLKSLKSYKIIEGYRGKDGINQEMFCNLVERLSSLLSICPEIKELDINPIIANSKTQLAVDVRIRIEK